ncbi:universal stress protein [Mucilaginibacter xinganensis]|uniref:Universal stress protein n=1 Tax=Mucilaginibacter xinganensis TaxID=1234841 RepID=A0A223NR51_9SPHI|nr:universal stress protein [Mucilaginibacter xinganensis]ASU32385.1 hypothetical protein MuYL_0482 [Mucilaginibacter xinganensis]
MKKISAAFDGLRFSDGTLQYAIKIAEASKALLSGVFLESFLYHGYKLNDMVGEHGISEVKMKHLAEKDNEVRLKSADLFKDTCKKEHINYTIHHDKNFAELELLRESIYSDLILISADETLSQITTPRPTPFIRQFLAETQCPALIVPRVYKPIKKVILLFDGKPSSVFAIKMFNYLMPWLRSMATEVVSVTDPDDKSPLPDETLLREFIQCHYPEATYTLLKGNPEQAIITYLKSIDHDFLVVLGAYHRSQVSRWFKTSLADILMKEIDMPLFVAHNK